jgi:hypothetical protein
LSFSVDIWNGSTLVGQALLGGTPINGIIPLTTGTGTSGWLIAYTNEGLLTNFFANPTWVLGASGSISAAKGGQDNFYLINKTVTPPPVPEPTTLLLFGLGLVGLAGIRRMRQ